MNNAQQSLGLGNIYNNIPGHFYFKDVNGIYRWCNNNQAKTLGLISPKDIIGKTDNDLIWCNEAKLYRRNDLRVIDSKSQVTVEEMAFINNTQTIYLSNKAPLKRGDGCIIGVIGVSIEITTKTNLKVSIAETVGLIHPAFEKLSKRELEVVNLIMAGYNNKQIAINLQLSVKTIYEYRHRVFEKLNIKTNSELMSFCK